MVHAIAFALVGELRRDHAEEAHFGPPHRYRRRGPLVPVLTTDKSPITTSESRYREAEARLAGILADQGFATSAVEIARRRVMDDPVAARIAGRARPFDDHHALRIDGKIFIAAVRLENDGQWLVARVRQRRDASDLIWPLLMQTLSIYVVLVGALAFILRRITRPLAKLTERTERFAKTRDVDGQMAPQGPDDVRRLIAAHNAMENNISALLDEKDVMLGAIGHDLKTPLAALRVRVESVEDETERGRMAETIEDITRSLDDILSLARVGRASDPAERSELSALIASVVEEYEDMGAPVRLGETSRTVAELRQTWLRRALRNLIDNAIRYGGEATVSLRSDGGEAVIAVDDSGPGISEDAMADMMNPFTRGDPSRNKGTGGAGLGLALARAIAEQHGGTLRLANRSEGGLRAEFRLPV